jgi:hypothetical protein
MEEPRSFEEERLLEAVAGLARSDDMLRRIVEEMKALEEGHPPN